MRGLKSYPQESAPKSVWTSVSLSLSLRERPSKWKGKQEEMHRAWWSGACDGKHPPQLMYGKKRLHVVWSRPRHWRAVSLQRTENTSDNLKGHAKRQAPTNVFIMFWSRWQLLRRAESDKNWQTKLSKQSQSHLIILDQAPTVYLLRLATLLMWMDAPIGLEGSLWKIDWAT